jgi:hypothetical protein
MGSQNIPKDFFVNLVKENSGPVCMVWSYGLVFCMLPL